MDYFAHIDGKRKQSVLEHSEGVARLAGMFAGEFGKYEWGYCSGMLHDIGKYSLRFQRRLQKGDVQVDHSTAGAQLCAAKGGYYSFLNYCIAGHHAGLPDCGSNTDNGGESTLSGRLKKKIEDYQAYQPEIEVPLLHSAPIDPKAVPNPYFSLSFFMRMIYSCLVDADFLDTEAFMKQGKTERDPGTRIEELYRKLDKYLENKRWLENKKPDTINGRRSEILRHCMDMGTQEKGMFRLTVPTGGGKTIASLAFALRHAAAHQMKRIIYVIPYTNIIEQNAQVFREILGEENVLESHCNIDYTSSEELRPMQLASENWDKPVVVTTNVQFFESLFASKSSKCRKLHNVANSVIIFDEAQMIPPEHLKPCLAVIEELAAQYGSSVVLCTATQPTFQNFFQRNWEPVELCPCMEEQFRFFKRTRFEDIGTVTEEELEEKLLKETQALCIVNTKKRAQRIYNAIKGDGVFHLSTTMYPKHRKRVLEQIRKRLEDGKKCILIATSLVEAGVDLDFRSVYRQLAGMDSMIQAAGRGNRNGDRSIEESPVYIFRMEGKEFVPGQQMQIDTSKALLLDGYQLEDLATVDRYFQMLYQLKQDEMDKDGVMRCFENQNYQFASAAKKFHLIEENTVTVFVKREQEAAKLLGQIRNQGYSRTLMRQAGQYCINIYDRDFEKLNGQGALRPVSGDIEDFYELVSEELYTEEMGLKMDIEEGIGVFW